MGAKRKKLNDLFVINPEIIGRDLYLWISDDKDDIENMTYCINHCIAYNIYFQGFATDRQYLIGLTVLNKRIYDVKKILDKNALIVSEDKSSSFYCPVKILNPKLDISNIVIWGAGNNGKVIASYLEMENIYVNYFIDSDKNKVGKDINKIKIYSIEKIAEFSRDVSLIEASDIYSEIDKIMQERAPEINCYIYTHAGEDRYFVPPVLMYLREVVQNKKIYIYGSSYYARQLSKCLMILDYHFAGFLIDEFQYEESNKNEEIWMLPEEVLYSDNYFIIIASDNREAIVNKLKALGLKYAVDFSPIEMIPYYLLYARRNIIDTNLGHTYRQKMGMDGVEIYGNRDSGRYKIVALGGSTTDGKLFPFKSWVEILYDKIDDNNKITVYNAGVSGYTSAQELIKLIRDIVLLKPDMIIVYDGYNDTSEINACPGKYFEFMYLKKALDFARKHMDHGWDFIAEENEDTENMSGFPIVDNFENWLMNIEMMHAIAADRGIRFYAFLQPMLSSKKNLTDKEKGILFEVENFYGLKQTSLMGKVFRNRIENVLRSHEYIHDLSNIFDNYHDVYMDICHVREKANEIIAMEVLNRIEIPF